MTVLEFNPNKNKQHWQSTMNDSEISCILAKLAYENQKLEALLSELQNDSVIDELLGELRDDNTITELLETLRHQHEKSE